MDQDRRLHLSHTLTLNLTLTLSLSLCADDGSGPDKIAHIMGPPDRCEHAASIINDLLQSIRAREEGGGVSVCVSVCFSETDCKGLKEELRFVLVFVI